MLLNDEDGGCSRLLYWLIMEMYLSFISWQLRHTGFHIFGTAAWDRAAAGADTLLPNVDIGCYIASSDAVLANIGADAVLLEYLKDLRGDGSCICLL